MDAQNWPDLKPASYGATVALAKTGAVTPGEARRGPALVVNPELCFDGLRGGRLDASPSGCSGPT